MNNLKIRIAEVILMLEQTSTLFYQQKKQEGLQSLDLTIQNLMQLITEIYANMAEGNVSTYDENRMNRILGHTMSAIESSDMILVADFFIFELKPFLEQLMLN